MSELDDALRLAQAGDAEAYGRVVVATQARLRAFIAGYVPRQEWIDDVAQQAYVSAFRSLADFEIGTDFERWLRRVAFNHLRAELEKAGRRRRLDGLAAAELLRRLEREGEREDDRIDALRSCLDALPPVSRELVDSFYGDALPLADIGRRLGRTADSLKVTLFKIRARLRACVERRAAGEST